MYENEYGHMNNTEQQNTNPYITPPTGTYSNYTGYNASPNMVNQPAGKKKGHGKVVAACIALTLAGLLAGSGVSYAYLNARGNADKAADTVTEETTDSLFADKNDHVALNKSDDDAEISVAAELPTTAAGESMSVQQIADQCLSSVVAITNYGVTEIRSMWGNFTQNTTGAGSGVIIGQTDTELLILTNYHVIENNQSLSVVFSWEEDSEDIDKADILYASVKDYDESRDIAVIAIPIDELSDDVLSKITVATVGSSENLTLGEQVVAIGNALGYGQSVTTGIVSALNRKMESSGSSNIGEDNAYIQTDAAINPGNSGGALFNMKGELVGINAAKIGGEAVEGMGYAIPISDISGEVESMMNQETRDKVAEDERGYLGISIVDVTSEISETYGLPQGVYISAISAGSGAEKAGLEKEDIITGINGKKITSGSELTEYLSKYSIGETVTLTVSYRSGDGYESKDVEVTLGENPSGNSNNTLPQQEEQPVAPDEEQGDGWYGFGIPFPFGQ